MWSPNVLFCLVGRWVNAEADPVESIGLVFVLLEVRSFLLIHTAYPTHPLISGLDDRIASSALVLWNSITFDASNTYRLSSKRHFA